jgi:hypothetical protein
LRDGARRLAGELTQEVDAFIEELAGETSRGQ